MTKREAQRQVIHTLMAILTRGSIVDSDEPEVIEKCCEAQRDLAAWIATKKAWAFSSDHTTREGG